MTSKWSPKLKLEMWGKRYIDGHSAAAREARDDGELGAARGRALWKAQRSTGRF